MNIWPTKIIKIFLGIDSKSGYLYISNENSTSPVEKTTKTQVEKSVCNKCFIVL